MSKFFRTKENKRSVTSGISSEKRIFFYFIFFLVLFLSYVDGGVRKVKETMIPVWIYFTDKPISEKTPNASERALLRRQRVGFKDYEDREGLVSSAYLREIEKNGGILKNVFKWENAASFYLPFDKLPYVKSKSFVKRVSPVGRYIKKVSASKLKKKKYYLSEYGYLSAPLSTLNIPRAHLYLKYMFKDKLPGEGVRVAFFDSGFRLDHPCFKHLHKRGAIKATYDFIDHDTTVEDPDSVRNDFFHPLWMNDIHGSEVLAIFSGYDPPYYCGVAYGADLLLART
ncbi:MAG: hypothetical protein N2053_09370, partial [Chitinispirillaceae bacterium]|nr:hypothetical protein [Chitinispirillaceae bacterium]